MRIPTSPLGALLGPVLGLVLVTSGCAALDVPTGDPGKVQVAAGFYPLAYAAEQVGGDDVQVTDLTHPGAEPHDLELTIRQTVSIATADLVVYEHGFQPAVDASVAQNAEHRVLDVSGAARLQPFADDPAQPDPHFWQDPLRFADVGDAMAAQLAAADPAHAAAYRSRAAAFRTRLLGLDQEYAAGLADCARSTVVVTHDAFGYLEQFGIRVAPILGLSPDAEATPADLGRLQDLVRHDGITTVFSERLVSSKAADTLAADLGVSSRVLDPIEGLSDATADQDYLSLMRENLSALEQANGCR
ncbi:MAG: metal ABC transporter substrate-binding protein [Nocardioides sp.]